MNAHGSHARRTDRSAVGAAERRSCATLAVPVAVPLTMAGVFADAARPDDGLARGLGQCHVA